MKKLFQAQKDRHLRTQRLRLRKAGRRSTKRDERLRSARSQQAEYREKLRRAHLVPTGAKFRHPIILPEVFSFADNFEETAASLTEIKCKGLEEWRPLMIRFDKVRKVDAPALLALAAEIYRCKKLRQLPNVQFVSGTYPGNSEIFLHLRAIGFYSLIEVEQPPGDAPRAAMDKSKAYLHMRTGTNVDGEVVDRFVSVVEKNAFPLNEVARGKLVGAIKEAMGNVADHAYKIEPRFPAMKSRWYMSAYIDFDLHEVKVLLFDQGVGIPRTLDANMLARLQAASKDEWVSAFKGTDGYTVKLATEIWQSGTGQSGRGKGFRDMKQFVAVCADGELTVLSNRGRYTYMPEGEHFHDHESSAGGTIIEWRFRNEDRIEIDDD
jgi:hypothetical protein